MLYSDRWTLEGQEEEEQLVIPKIQCHITFIWKIIYIHIYLLFLKYYINVYIYDRGLQVKNPGWLRMNCLEMVNSNTNNLSSKKSLSVSFYFLSQSNLFKRWALLRVMMCVTTWQNHTNDWQVQQVSQAAPPLVQLSLKTLLKNYFVSSSLIRDWLVFEWL